MKLLDRYYYCCRRDSERASGNRLAAFAGLATIALLAWLCLSDCAHKRICGMEPQTGSAESASPDASRRAGN